MIKTKSGFILRHLADEYMIVPIGEAGQDFHGIIRMNETGAYVWNLLDEGIEYEQLIEKVMEHYEDADSTIVKADVDFFLDSVAVALEK